MTLNSREDLIIFGDKKISAIAAGLIVISVSSVLYFFIGIGAMLIIGGSGAIAWVVWLKTTYQHPVDPNRVLPLYLLLLAAELLHMGEEFLTSFPDEFSKLTGASMTQEIFIIWFVIVGTILALLSMIGIMHQNPLSNFFLWFVIIGPGFVNGIAHFIFPLLAGTFYFPGLITVLLPVAVGIYLAVRIYKDVKNQKKIHQYRI